MTVTSEPGKARCLRCAFRVALTHRPKPKPTIRWKARGLAAARVRPKDLSPPCVVSWYKREEEAPWST